MGSSSPDGHSNLNSFPAMINNSDSLEPSLKGYSIGIVYTTKPFKFMT